MILAAEWKWKWKKKKRQWKTRERLLTPIWNRFGGRYFSPRLIDVWQVSPDRCSVCCPLAPLSFLFPYARSNHTFSLFLIVSIFSFPLGVLFSRVSGLSSLELKICIMIAAAADTYKSGELNGLSRNLYTILTILICLFAWNLSMNCKWTKYNLFHSLFTCL